MKLFNLVPGFLKPMLRPLGRVFMRLIYRPKPLDEIHEYWKHPWDFDNSNLPESYLKAKERSLFLVDLIKRYADSNSRILEIGCNVGRNLNFLFSAGFSKLAGIEINKKAVDILKMSYPEMARSALIHNLPIEKVVTEFKDNEFDIIFTMAVLEHIHIDSQWIFPHIARVTGKFLIVIEDEVSLTWRHFPRSYKEIFERLGMRQIWEDNCRHIKGLGREMFARVFEKR